MPPEEVERRLHEAARDLGRQMRIPGFRKGKVPPPVVISRLGRDAVLDEALRELARRPGTTTRSSRPGSTPVGEPELDVGELPGEGEPLAFSIEMGVMPLAVLGDYKGVEVARREAEAGTGDRRRGRGAARTRRDARDRRAPREPRRPRGDGLLRQGRRRADRGRRGRDQLLELGSGRMIPGFEEQLVGAKAGEERDVTSNSRRSYRRALGGKAATLRGDRQGGQGQAPARARRRFRLETRRVRHAGGASRGHRDAPERGRAARRSSRSSRRRCSMPSSPARQIEVPQARSCARARNVAETMSSLARQGISKEVYLQIAGKDEEKSSTRLSPRRADAATRGRDRRDRRRRRRSSPATRRCWRRSRPTAEREEGRSEELLERLRKTERLGRLREELATRQAMELLVRRPSRSASGQGANAGAGAREDLDSGTGERRRRGRFEARRSLVGDPGN